MGGRFELGKVGKVVESDWRGGEVVRSGGSGVTGGGGKKGVGVNSARLNWEGRDRGEVWHIYIVSPCGYQGLILLVLKGVRVLK
nr:hypothetical protein [Tanacetum cinerariifolium]